jgi:hypothetical protein
MELLSKPEYELKLRTIVNEAWDREVSWPEIESWINNFTGEVLDRDKEQLYSLFALSRFMYFSKKLVREMLKSLYRDQFESPLIQRIRRKCRGTSNSALIRKLYAQELSSTRFIGVGNPSESGAHLLYYFRQVNYLPKNLFVDLGSAFIPDVDPRTKLIRYIPRESGISRYVFFDDLVGSGTQASGYLAGHLSRIRCYNKSLDLRFMSLFATTEGLNKLNNHGMFNGKAMCLFELDETYKAFDKSSRYFSKSPPHHIDDIYKIANSYGEKLQPRQALGYKGGQLMLGFSHNTPDNTLPIFWDEGHNMPWSPVFIRYDKNYGAKA